MSDNSSAMSDRASRIDAILVTNLATPLLLPVHTKLHPQRLGNYLRQSRRTSSLHAVSLATDQGGRTAPFSSARQMKMERPEHCCSDRLTPRLKFVREKSA